MIESKKPVRTADAFDVLANWIDRQQDLNHGSDFQLSDHALNMPVVIEMDGVRGMTSIDAWGLGISVVHLTCFTQQLVPTDQSIRISLPLPGIGPTTLNGRIVYCSQCLPGMFRTGVVLDWESLASGNDSRIDAFERDGR